jgi:hypothetical protein
LLFTPVRSPESNGISESFVKTLKRDYARLNILHDADAILAMLFLAGLPNPPREPAQSLREGFGRGSSSLS